MKYLRFKRATHLSNGNWPGGTYTYCGLRLAYGEFGPADGCNCPGCRNIYKEINS